MVRSQQVLCESARKRYRHLQQRMPQCPYMCFLLKDNDVDMLDDDDDPMMQEMYPCHEIATQYMEEEPVYLLHNPHLPEAINDAVSIDTVLLDAESLLKHMFSTTERMEVQLLKLLQDMKCPKYVYVKVMDWAHDAAVAGYEFRKPQKFRKTVLKQLEETFGTKELRAKESTIALLGHKHYDGVTPMCTSMVWSFEHQLLDLLNDPELMKVENLCVDPNNPLSGPYSPEIVVQFKILVIHGVAWEQILCNCFPW